MKDWVALKELYLRIKDCQRCELAKTRTKFVFGSGSEKARLMFIGEAPGYYEDQQGVPFVGPAGQLLDSLLAGIGLKREDVFIGNVLKCRPPNNRDPLKSEIDLCKEYLFEQIRIIRPAVICTLGRYSTALVLGREQPLSRVRGKVFKVNGTWVIPTYHPAAALYTRSNLPYIESDFEKIRDLLSGKEDSSAVLLDYSEAFSSAASEGLWEREGGSEQLGLF